MIFAVPPIRHRFGDGPRPAIPLTYPSKCCRSIASCSVIQVLAIISFDVCDADGGLDLVPNGPRRIPEGYDD